MNSITLLDSHLIIRLAEYAKCIISQLLHIKEARTSFEKLYPIIEKLSTRAGTSPNVILFTPQLFTVWKDNSTMYYMDP